MLIARHCFNLPTIRASTRWWKATLRAMRQYAINRLYPAPTWKILLLPGAASLTGMATFGALSAAAALPNLNGKSSFLRAERMTAKLGTLQQGMWKDQKRLPQEYYFPVNP